VVLVLEVVFLLVRRWRVWNRIGSDRKASVVARVVVLLVGDDVIFLVFSCII